MLYLPDFKEKLVLFIQASDLTDNKIKLGNDNIVFLKNGKVENRLSCHKVFVVFIIGEFSITSILIKKCLKYGVSVFLLDNNFKVYASFGAKAEGNYLLRMKQYAFNKELDLAKCLVKNKILNHLLLLRKSKILNKDDYHKLKKDLLKKIDKVKDSQELLGIEGNQQKTFYNQYFRSLGWYKRMPRTKVDPYNILLDIGYTLLFNYCDSLLRLYGFDTYKGIYHKLFFQRKSLTCDVVEPFRCIIDKELLKLFNLNQIKKKDFKFAKSCFSLDFTAGRKYVKIFLEAITDYKEDIFQFMRKFYRYFLKEEGEFPVFKIR